LIWLTDVNDNDWSIQSLLCESEDEFDSPEDAEGIAADTTLGGLKALFQSVSDG
jgi:hypothetical protein